MNFKIYFLLDRKLQIVPAELIEYAINTFPQFKGDVIDDKDYCLTYTNRELAFDAFFMIKSKSIIPDLHKLDPQYKNINMHLEFSPLLPSFKLSVLLDVITIIARKFSLSMYCEYFENVIPFKKDTILEAYNSYFKKKYIETYPDEVKDLYMVNTRKLTEYLTYENEIENLRKYCKDEDIFVPQIQYFYDQSTNKILTGINWKSTDRTIFPSFIDYVIYENAGEIRLLVASEVIVTLQKFISDLPGFMQGTKVIDESKLKKCNKLMNKARFSLTIKKFVTVKQTDLID